MHVGTGWLGAVVLVVGCSSHGGSAKRAQSPPRAGGNLAELVRSAEHDCPKLRPADRASSAAGRRQVFTELVLLEGPSATVRLAKLSSLAELARDPAVQVLAAPHVVGDLDQRVELTLVERIGISIEASLHRVNVTPREASDGTLVLELGVVLQLPNPNGAAPAPTASTSLMMSGAEQRLLLGSAPLPHRRDRALLAIVKYWRISETHDLRSIFECKMRQRQQALSTK
jgi:hypothetical protein